MPKPEETKRHTLSIHQARLSVQQTNMPTSHSVWRNQTQAQMFNVGIKRRSVKTRGKRHRLCTQESGALAHFKHTIDSVLSVKHMRKCQHTALTFGRTTLAHVFNMGNKRGTPERKDPKKTAGVMQASTRISLNNAHTRIADAPYFPLSDLACPSARFQHTLVTFL